MKVHFLLVLLLVLSSCNLGCTYGKLCLQKQSPDARLPKYAEPLSLYVTDTAEGEMVVSQRIDVHHLAEVLADKYLNSERERVIIFVHGKGNHPQKALKQGLIASLYEEYDAEVIMVHWPSFDEKSSIWPVHFAQKAGAAFGVVVDQIASVSNQKGDKQLTLLTHSMGARLLRGYTQSQAPLITDKVVDQIVLSAPELERAGHRDWLSEVGFARCKFVILNQKDSTLAGPTCLEQKMADGESDEPFKRLGQGWKLDRSRLSQKGLLQLIGRSALADQLDKHSVYIDLTEIVDTKHRYYIDNGENSELRRLYRNIFSGAGVPHCEEGAFYVLR